MITHPKMRMISPDEALPGRAGPIPTAESHFVNGRPLKGPYPQGAERVFFGMGCYWGAERRFWPLPGVRVTAVGNIAGFTPNPTYEEVCTGKTGHAEAVMVVFEPEKAAFSQLLKVFWENHDPTQHMRQGNDMGTQYRSGIWCETDEQLAQAQKSRETYQQALSRAGLGEITTEIGPAPEFHFAEEYHQQYLAKNPQGYCGAAGTGAAFPLEALTES